MEDTSRESPQGSTRTGQLQAHLPGCAQYAIDEGCAGFAPGFRLLLLRAMTVGRRRDGLKDTTLAQYHAQLERRLDRLLAGPRPDRPASRRLFRAMRRDRDDLLRFIRQRDVPATNNALCGRPRKGKRHPGRIMIFAICAPEMRNST
jgi:hypothetical protein